MAPNNMAPNNMAPNNMAPNNNGNGAQDDDRPPASTDGSLWRYSEARDQLAQDLIDGIIPMEGPFDSKDIFDNLWADLPAFKQFPYDKQRYDDRITSMRRQVSSAQFRAAADHVALLNDRKVCPRKTTNSKGKPIWNGSEAQAKLRNEVSLGLHKTFRRPKQMWSSSPLYKAFDLQVFRKQLDYEKEKLKPFDKRPGQCKPKNFAWQHGYD